MTNIKHDPNLKEDFKPRLLVDPLIIVEQTDDGSHRIIISPERMNEKENNAAGWGVLMSDLIDHIAHMGATLSGRDARDVRAAIVKVMRDEDRFKEKDPNRGQLTGAFSIRDVQ
jgi:hypothetical protein